MSLEKLVESVVANMDVQPVVGHAQHACSQEERHHSDTVVCEGSIPSRRTNINQCPQCGTDDYRKREVRNYCVLWQDGDIYCTVCEAYIRYFDAG